MMWRLLSVFLCFVVLAASESAVLTIQGSNGDLTASLNSGPLDFDIVISEIVEITSEWINNDASSFPWENYTSTELRSYISQNFPDDMVGFLINSDYCCETSTYTFGLVDGNVNGTFLPVDSTAGFELNRDPFGKAFISLISAQATETFTVAYTGEFAEAFGAASYTIPRGANKFQVNVNWPTNYPNSTGLILSMSVDYTYDLNIDPLSLDIPTVDYEEIKKDGNFIGVRITVDDTFFELLLPDFPIGSFSDIGGHLGNWDGVTGTPIPNLDWNFNCYSGKVNLASDYLSGSFTLHCIVNALNATTGEPARLPHVIAIDPVVTGENSAGSLSSWTSYLF